MKKVMFLMAVAGMFAFAACNSKTADEAAVDTTPATPVEEAVEAPVQDVADSAAMPAEDAAATQEVAK